MHAIAVQYARELARWGIETSIVVPGAFSAGTSHFAHAGAPADAHVLADHEAGPYAGFGEEIRRAFAAIVPPDTDAAAVADAIVGGVDAPPGRRPFRVHVDPAQDGADVGFTVLDRLRAGMLHRVGMGDLLRPAVRPGGAPSAARRGVPPPPRSRVGRSAAAKADAAAPTCLTRTSTIAR